MNDTELLDALERLLWSPNRQWENLLIMPYWVERKQLDGTFKGECHVSIAHHEDSTGLWDEIADAPTLREAIERATKQKEDGK